MLVNRDVRYMSWWSPHAGGFIFFSLPFFFLFFFRMNVKPEKMWKESRMKHTAYHSKLTERRCVAGEVIVWMPRCESVRDWWNLSGASLQFCFLIWDHCRKSHKWLSNGTRYIHKIWLFDLFYLFAKAVLTLHNNRSCQWNDRKRSLNKYPISNVSF